MKRWPKGSAAVKAGGMTWEIVALRRGWVECLCHCCGDIYPGWAGELVPLTKLANDLLNQVGGGRW